MKITTASTGVGMSNAWPTIDHKNRTQFVTIDELVTATGFSLSDIGGRSGLAAIVCTLST